jgi:hypothetical protein
LSREDHRNYDAALLKLRAETAAKPKEKEHHTRELVLLGIGSLTDFLAVKFANSIFVWIAGAFFVVALWSYTKHRLSNQRARYALNVVGLILVGLGTFYLDAYKVQPDRKIDQLLLGQRYGSEALFSQYPNGYVIFNLSYNDKVVFYKGRSAIDDYDFDWEKVKYLSNTNDSFEVQMPDIKHRGGIGGLVMSTRVGGPKTVGYRRGFFADRKAGVGMVCEILDTDEKGIVFLIGPLH